MAYINHREAKLFFECHGKAGLPLFFIHGGGCDHTDWQYQVAFFRERQRVMSCDLRGHGKSDCKPGLCTVENFGADVNSIMVANGLPPAVLIGHSTGCRVALQAYLDRPQQVAGLVLIEGSRLGNIDPQEAEKIAREIMEALGHTAVVHSIYDGMFFEGSDPALKERILDRVLNMPAAALIRTLESLAGWDSRNVEKALSQVDVPLLAIQSTHVDNVQRVPLQADGKTPWLDLIRQQVPSAQVKIVSDAGHFPMLEVPDVVNRAIAEFVDTQLTL